MKNRRNYYRILQVQPDAPLEIIKSSYRTLMGKLNQHPDRGGSLWSASTINEAYETLSDPLKRVEYDQTLSEYPRSKASPGASTEKPGKAHAEPQACCTFCKAPYPGDGVERSKCPSCGRAFHPSERRVFSRTQRREKLLYYAPGSSQRSPGIIIDFSPGGMRFTALEKIAPHTTIRIESPSLQATAQVIHCRKSRSQNGPSYTIGVKFTRAEFEKARGTFFSATV